MEIKIISSNCFVEGLYDAYSIIYKQLWEIYLLLNTTQKVVYICFKWYLIFRDFPIRQHEFYDIYVIDVLWNI